MPTPTDVVLVLRHVLDWRFLISLIFLLAAGLFIPARYLQPFRSVRFNIILFAVIALTAMPGTFYPNSGVYHSVWFTALLGLMAFDVVACKLRKGAPLIHGVPQRNEERSVHRLFSSSRFRETVSTILPPPVAETAVRDWLGDIGVGFRVVAVRTGDREHATGFFAAKHRLQRWGDLILHVSIVIVLAGGLMGALYGFDEMLPIPVGQTVRLKHRPVDVTLDDFDIEYYRSGEVSRYTSQLTVRENGAVLGRKRVRVNDPLDIDRLRFYQASWGITPNFRSAVLRLGGRDVVVRPGEPVRLGGSLSVRANHIVPTFEITPEGRVHVADYHGNNPALQLDFLEDGQPKASLWILYRRPEAYRIDGDRVVRAAPPPFQWVAFDPVLFSGIQVGYDPGAPLFWFGAILLMAGLCGHFYLHLRRLRVVILPKDGGSEILIGGWNSRTPVDFESEFQQWMDGLRGRLAQAKILAQRGNGSR